MAQQGDSDLNSVIRDQLRKRIDQTWGGSVSAAAQALGVSQTRLNRFVAGKGLKVDFLDDILSALKTNIIDFLVAHESFRELRPTWRAERYSHYAERLERLYDADDLEEVFQLIETAKALQIDSSFRMICRQLIETHRTATLHNPRAGQRRPPKHAKHKRKSP